MFLHKRQRPALRLTHPDSGALAPVKKIPKSKRKALLCLMETDPKMKVWIKKETWEDQLIIAVDRMQLAQKIGVLMETSAIFVEQQDPDGVWTILKEVM